jgi:hypothetical protein
MSKYLGDFLRDDAVDCWWDSANSLGAAANPTSAGTVFVCVSNTSSAATQVGITLTSGIFTGIHSIRVSMASTTGFFLPERNYSIVASGYTIDGQSVNKVLGAFSVENRYETGLIRRGTFTAASASTASLDATASSVSSFYDGCMLLVSDNTGKVQGRLITSYAATGKIASFDRAFATAPANGSTFRLYAGSLPSQDNELGTAMWSSYATRTLTGTSTATITRVTTVDSVSTVTALGAGAINAAAFAAAAITSTVLAANAITATQIATASLDSTKATADFFSAITAGIPTVTQLNSGVTVTSLAANVVTATAIAANAITATKIAASSLDSTKATADFYNEAADKFLARNVAGGSSSARSVSEALFTLRNKVDATGSIATVYKTDDTTSAFTFSYTTSNGPFSSVDPA